MTDYSKYSYITQADYEAASDPKWPPFSTFIKHQQIPDFVYAEIDARLAPPVQFSHPSFCVLPFYGIEYPQNTPCCLTPVGCSRETIKNEMLNGLRPIACKKCWTIEDAGLKSDRLIKNETLDFYYDRNIQGLYQECLGGNSKIVHYKIDTNNVCNLTCVTCGSNSSSAWAKLEQANNVIPRKTWQLEPADVDTLIDYSTAKSIGFRGGEPFMSKTNFYILEQLLKYKNTNCFISFTTNGTFSLTQKQKKLIANFPNMNFCFSIDGVGPVFEYLRFPARFSQIENNIKFCRDNGIIIGVSYTISNLNILYHSQTVQWFKDNQLEFLNNIVYNPNCFRPSALPEQVKQQIINRNSIDLSNFLGTHTNKDDVDYVQFRKEIEKQDKWKNIQLRHYLPELASLLDQ